MFCCVDVAVSIGEAAKPRIFCYADVAVSIGEAAKPRVFCGVDVAVSIPRPGFVYLIVARGSLSYLYL